MKGYKHWNAEQLTFLKENYGKLPIAEISRVVGRNTTSVTGKAVRLGIAKKFPLVGKLNGNWRGGITNVPGGYIRNNVTNKLQHREIVEEALGRPLGTKELVHHIDGDKHNNTLANLYVCRDMAHHRLIHWSLERLAMSLVKRGLIVFDKETGNYTFKHSLAAFDY